jgi:cyclic beta-1,2-glucan synthetase
LLSNGTYNVMITTAGSGYSQCEENAVTRWREDVTRDNWGAFIYLRDVRSGAVWSAGHQPVRRKPQSYHVAFSEDKADFRRVDSGISTRMEVVVSAKTIAEVRRIRSQTFSRTREIDYQLRGDRVASRMPTPHTRRSAIFSSRRIRSGENAILPTAPTLSDERPIWGVHVCCGRGNRSARSIRNGSRPFFGRGRTASNPIAVMEDRPLSNTTGACSIRFSVARRVRILRIKRPLLVQHCGRALARRSARARRQVSRSKHLRTRAASRLDQGQVEMSHLKIDREEAHLFQRLAARIVYSDPSLRPTPHVLALNTKAQSSLWAYGISGDCRSSSFASIKPPTCDREEARARHEYLHYKGLRVDLVILNDTPTTISVAARGSGHDDSHQRLARLTGQTRRRLPARSDQMPEADRILCTP